MGSIIAIWRIVVRRAFANWKMLGVLAVGILVAATLLASAPVYSRTMNDLGLTYSVQEQLPGGPGTSVQVRGMPVGDEGAAMREAVGERIDDRLGWFSDETHRFDRLGALAITDPGDEPIDGGPGGWLQSVTAYDQHVTVLEGRLPELPGPGEPVEVAIHPEAASTASLEVGDSIELHERLDDCEQRVIPGDMPTLSPCPDETPTVHVRFSVEAEVVGMIEPADEDDPFWLGGLNPYFGIQRSLPATGPWVPLWTAPGAVAGPFAEQFPGYTADMRWNVFADAEAITQANYERAYSDIAAIRAELETANAIVGSPLASLLERVSREQDYQQTPLTVLLLQVAAIALFYVVIVSSIVVDRQALEIALLRSRGAGLRQVLTVYLFEGLIIGVPILLAAPFLAAAATALAGYLPVFEPVSGGELLPVAIPPLAFGMAAIGVVLSLVALAVPAFIVARRSSVSQRRAEARPSPSIVQRYYLDLILAAFAGLLLWELNERGSAFEPSPTGGLTSDPILLASPALMIVAAAALILRFYPLFLRWVARLVTPAAGVSLASGLWQVVRSPGQYTRLTLLVMMAVAVGTFAASYSSTAERSYQDRADFEAGADLRAMDTEAAGARDLGVKEAEMAELPGADQVSIGHRADIQTGTTGAQAQSVEMLAVDPLPMSDIIYTRDDYADEPVTSLLMNLQGAPEYSGIELPAETETVSVWVNSIADRDNITLWARVRDDEGRTEHYELGKLESQGWTQLEANIRDGAGRALEEPVSLTGLIFTEPPNRFNTSPEPLYLADLAATDGTGEETLLEAFDGSRDWSPLPSLSGSRDEFEFTPEAAREGDSGGEFHFREGVQDERRALHPVDGSVPLLALASRGFLAQTGTSVGSIVHMRVGEVLVPTRIVGTYDLFPTLSAQAGPSIVYNRDQLMSWVNPFTLSSSAQVHPREMWFGLEDGASATELDQALREPPHGAQILSNREEAITEVEQNPLIAAGGSGILQLSFIAVLVLVAGALLLSLWAAVQRRRVEFAVMRAMGVSRGQILRQLAIEYALVGVLGVVVGAYLGQLVGRQMLSFLDVTADGRPVEPSFILQTDWGFVLGGALVVLLVFVVALGVAVRVLGRIADAQALRSE